MLASNKKIGTFWTELFRFQNCEWRILNLYHDNHVLCLVSHVRLFAITCIVPLIVPLGESTSLYLLQVEGLCKLGYFPKNSPMFWMYLEQFSEEFKLSQAPLSMGFSRQEYWNGLPRPPPGESSQPRSWTQVSIAGEFFTIWATREAHGYHSYTHFTDVEMEAQRIYILY